VPLGSDLFAAAWILPSLVLVTLVGIRQRHRLWAALPVGAVAVWALLATNDIWGANQEPYRFWLDAYSIIAVLTVPLVVWAVSAGFARTPKGAETADVEAPPSQAWSTRARVVLALGLVVSVLAAGVSAADWFVFRRGVTQWGYVPLSTPRYLAAADLASRSDGGLVLADVCIDPLIFKIASGGPVVFYNPGLAWPTHVDDIKTLLVSRGSGVIDMAAARRADVRWVLVDPTCTVDIRPSLAGEKVQSEEYSDDGRTVSGSFELWHFDG
jgi:hypothetical protein